MEQEAQRQGLIRGFMTIGHGNLASFYDVGYPVAREDPFFLAHFLAWNMTHTQIRDSLVAWPVVGTRTQYFENAVAAAASLAPRELSRFLAESTLQRKASHPVFTGAGNMIEAMVHQYLAVREANIGWWDRTVLSNRYAIEGLYRRYHVTLSPRVKAVFNGDYPKGSVFEIVGQLKNMSAEEAAGAVMQHRIPMPVWIGAIGDLKSKGPIMAMAIIETSTATQLLNNTKMLEKLGMSTNPVLAAAYSARLAKVAATDKKAAGGKVQKAIAATTDVVVKAQLENVQKQMLDTSVGKIKGNVLVAGDLSGSMSMYVPQMLEVAAFVTERCEGKVLLSFFDTHAVYYDVTGMSLTAMKKKIAGIHMGGGTSIGSSMDKPINERIDLDVVLVISDGDENTSPTYADQAKKYETLVGHMPMTYWLTMGSRTPVFLDGCKRNDVPIEEIDLRKGVDYYSLGGITKLVRTNRYALLEEVMNTDLLTLAGVFKVNEEPVYTGIA